MSGSESEDPCCLPTVSSRADHTNLQIIPSSPMAPTRAREFIQVLTGPPYFQFANSSEPSAAQRGRGGSPAVGMPFEASKVAERTPTTSGAAPSPFGRSVVRSFGRARRQGWWSVFLGKTVRRSRETLGPPSNNPGLGEGGEGLRLLYLAL